MKFKTKEEKLDEWRLPENIKILQTLQFKWLKALCLNWLCKYAVQIIFMIYQNYLVDLIGNLKM